MNEPNARKVLAIFDFDGTVTRSDSLFHFLEYIVGKEKLYRGLAWLSPTLILYKAGILSNNVAKERLFRHFFKGWEARYFDEMAANFARNDLPSIVRQSALNKMRWHLDNDHVVVVVSASIENYLVPWCRKQGVQCIGTRLDIKEGALTGNFSGANCTGQEKVTRIRSAYSLDDFKQVYAYGDSSGDREILQLATDPYYRHFK